jgi:hypothetical protein
MLGYCSAKSKGIIDCIQNDFASFLPENKKVDTRFKNWKPFIGEHFGFYHSGSLTDKEVLASFQRKIQRFIAHCNSSSKCIFIRTCVNEYPDYERICDVLLTKYPLLSFIIFLIKFLFFV